MKLNKRGERVLAFYIFFTIALFVGALAVGAGFLLTHHQVIDRTSCHQTEDGLMCDFTWERNK
jgi:hypothetical protein